MNTIINFNSPTRYIGNLINPPQLIRHRYVRSCCNLCGSIGDTIILYSKSRYRTCSCCKKIIKLQAQNMIKKREIRIKRENDKVILSLCIRDCLHFDYLRSSHSGLARYMLGFI